MTTPKLRPWGPRFAHPDPDQCCAYLGPWDEFDLWIRDPAETHPFEPTGREFIARFSDDPDGFRAAPLSEVALEINLSHFYADDLREVQYALADNVPEVRTEEEIRFQTAFRVAHLVLDDLT